MRFLLLLSLTPISSFAAGTDVTPVASTELLTAIAIAVAGWFFSLLVSALNEYLRRKQAAGEPKNPTLIAIASVLNLMAANPDKAATQAKAAKTEAP